MTAIHDMSTERLRAELAVADRHLRSHRQGIGGSCLARICPEKWPCKVYKNALKTVDQVAPVLKAREQAEPQPVAELREQARAEWS